MKLNFRKISAIATSALMVGMTMGSAIALAPSDKAFDAVVYGAAADASDKTQADSISTWLGLQTTSGGGTLTGEGDQYQIDKGEFHLGMGYLDAKAGPISDSNLPTLLADGTYLDNDNNEFEFTQKINLANNTLALWEDNDYAADVPTLGFKISSSTNVLNYTLSFGDDPYFKDLEGSDITIMGKDYYVLSVNSANTTITLLDSANTVNIAEGETQTVAGKTVSIDFVGSTTAKINVDGEITKSLAVGDTYKLKDGTYVGIKDISYNAKDTGISKVEFAIGTGKLVLSNGATVELNTVDVSGLTATLGGAGGTQLTSIIIQWDTDDTAFITPTTELSMPGFNAVKLSFTGMDFPKEEIIGVDGGEYIKLNNFPLKGGNVDIPIAFWDATNDWFDIIGSSANAGDEWFITNATNITLDYDTERNFIATYDDGNTAESYLMKFDSPGDDNKTTFSYNDGSGWKTALADAENGDSIEVGEVSITVGEIIGIGSANTVNLKAASNVNFGTIISKEGMLVTLPWRAYGTGAAYTRNITNATTYANDLLACDALGIANNLMIQTAIVYNVSAGDLVHAGTCAQRDINITFAEEDKDGVIAKGGNISVVLNATGTAADDHVDVASYVIPFGGYSKAGSGIEDGNTNKFVNYAYSALATKVVWDRDTEPESIELTYHGEESSGNVFITSTSVSAVTTTGNMVFTDAEKTSWQGYNVILVGGSCINTATATALGLSPNTCTDAWTAATGAGDGKYLIQSVGDKFTTGKTALVVAGYTKDNTVAASTYLRTNGAAIDTTPGKKYIGTVGAGLSSTITEV